MAKIYDFCPMRLLPGKTEELPRQALASLQRPLHGGNLALDACCGGSLPQYFQVAPNDHHKIIEVVRNPTRELTDSLHPSRLLERFLNLQAARHFSGNSLFERLIEAPQLFFGLQTVGY